MKNGDFIRNMNNDQLTNLLFLWGINTVRTFIESGGQKIMDHEQLGKWMGTDDFSCAQTEIGMDYSINSDFSSRKN
jgi:hypothetical protein